MSDHDADEVEYSRNRAANARALAFSLTSEEARRLMVPLAESYDELAVKAERDSQARSQDTPS